MGDEGWVPPSPWGPGAHGAQIFFVFPVFFDFSGFYGVPGGPGCRSDPYKKKSFFDIFYNFSFSIINHHYFNAMTSSFRP